jgi:hypothetical protein
MIRILAACVIACALAPSAHSAEPTPADCHRVDNDHLKAIVQSVPHQATESSEKDDDTEKALVFLRALHTLSTPCREADRRGKERK